MKVITVVGSRPQFIKSAAVSNALRETGIHEVLIHTGQHYDQDMSDVFFQQLRLPEPSYKLEVGSGTHAEQTGLAMIKIEVACLKEKPDMVLVYGDTNATLSGALAAAKLKVPVAHVESGLRSGERSMPEEVNRIITDHVSSVLFCPTREAVKNLALEGIKQGVHEVGDVMLDSWQLCRGAAANEALLLKKMKLQKFSYVLATIHRDFNVDFDEPLNGLVQFFMQCSDFIVLPVHPRLKKRLIQIGVFDKLKARPQLRLIDPVGYFEMLQLETFAKIIITDSGGVQKEAFFSQVPCVTVRPSTEWVETIQSGWNRLCVADSKALTAAVNEAKKPAGPQPSFYGDGKAAYKIAEIIRGYAG